MMNKNCTAPRAAHQGTPSDTNWGRIPDVEAKYRIPKGSQYSLIHAKKIQSVLVPLTGTQRGIRLVYLPSVEAFLRGLLSEQDPGGRELSPSLEAR